METGSKIKLLDMAASEKDTDSMAGDKEHLTTTGNYYQTMETQAKVLGEAEKVFLKLAEDSDIQGTKNHLEENPGCNINVVDFQGRTVLAIAVQVQSLELVEYLLTLPGIHIADSILYAVREENNEILQMLLDFQDAQEAKGLMEPTYESAEFLPHMTPLMLACHEENYEVVRQLLVRGQTINVPTMEAYKDHPYARFGPLLELGLARLDAYRALSAHTYLALSSEDPILTAFTLCNEAKKLSTNDPIFRNEYEEIAEKSEEFAVNLLDLCRGSEEVWLMFKQEHDPKIGIPCDQEYPRLRLALLFQLKEFVTHKNCQQVLQNLWSVYHPNVMMMNGIQIVLYFLPRLFLLPLIYIGYFFAPCFDKWKYLDAPMNKFMGDLFSYVLFLIFLLVATLNGSENPGQRVPKLNGVDWCIWIWIASYIWDHAKIVYFHGLKALFSSALLVYDVLMNLCFVTCFLARVAALIQSHEHGKEYRHQPRKFWPWNDPALVSEAFFCMGTMLAFARVLRIFLIGQTLGPLQLSLGRMMADVARMLIIIFVFLFAYSMSLTRLYIYYGGSARITPDGDVEEQPEAFTTLLLSFKSLFWNIFGFGDVTFADVVVDNTCPDDANKACYNATYHNFTEGSGYFIYGMYQLIMMTVLLNMLIALMSDTFAKIQENADREWKFARSKIWMQYFEKHTLLPNPFTIIPTVKDVMDLTEWIMVKVRRPKDKVAKFSKQQCWYIETKEDEKRDETIKLRYKELLDKLVTRYMNKLEQKEQQEGLTTEDLEQLKHDIMTELDRIMPKRRRRMRMQQEAGMASADT